MSWSIKFFSKFIEAPTGNVNLGHPVMASPCLNDEYVDGGVFGQAAELRGSALLVEGSAAKHVPSGHSQACSASTNYKVVNAGGLSILWVDERHGVGKNGIGFGEEFV